MTGAFSKGRNSGAAVTVNMAEGAHGDAPDEAGPVSGKRSVAKNGFPAAASPTTTEGVSVTAGVTVPGPSSPTPIGDATATAGSGSSWVTTTISGPTGGTTPSGPASATPTT